MVISIMIPIVIVLLVVLLIVGIAGAKGSSEKGGEEMIKHVYVYLVLFATLMMTIGGSVAAFMAVADIVSPVGYYQSYEDFRRYGNEKPMSDIQEPALSETELQTRYQALVTAEKERQIERAKNNLVKSFGWIVIPLPVFIFFQRRLAKKEA